MAQQPNKYFQIEPFRVRVLQIVFIVFTAGVVWNGYQTLSKTVEKLTVTMDATNKTMLVMHADSTHDRELLLRLQADAERNNRRETIQDVKLSKHDAEIEALNNQVFK